ncbi:MAG: outer membrane lipoprotein-sorting protein [Spirochaetota bacterium]|nr:outer membrane lipoprotein-sorting protein [Spirochaetota bacterium]
MKNSIGFSLFTLFIVLLATLAFGDSRAQGIYKGILGQGIEKGKAIAMTGDQMDVGFKSQTSRMRMTLINAAGDKIVRVMDSKRLEGSSDGDYSLIRFVTPNDVKGTGLLTHEHKTSSDDQWLYLPARKRIKRISSDNKSGSFMGSEFSYEDMGGREIEKYRYKYIGEDSFEGQDCFVTERYPTELSSGYTKMISWVRKDNFQPIKVDYYDRKREHMKTLLLKKYKKIGKFWRAHFMDMENVQTGKKTTLEFLNLKLGVSLSKSDFTTRSLEIR